MSFLHILLFLLYLLSVTISANSSAILYEMDPFIRVYRDGRVERLLGTKTVPPSVDSRTGVRSKDVKIAPNVSARIYVPKNANQSHKIPLLVYFHGGAFCTGSAFAPEYQNHLNTLVAESNVVTVSVNYRLAPENPLPIGYDDSWFSLKWIFSRYHDPWLKKYVNFRHVYFGGDSSGGNIAHNMAIQAGFRNPDGIKIEGMFLNCPYFWGKKPIGNEASDIQGKALMKSIWIHAYPNSTGFDDPLVNPGKDLKLSMMGGKMLLVYVAEKDILKDRGWYYADVLEKSKWNDVVKVVEAKGEEHVFSIRFQDRPKSKEMIKQLASFLNQRKEI